MIFPPSSCWACFAFKSAPPRMSQIGWRYQSGGSARRRRVPLGPYCPPARLCSGRTGTAGGCLHCCHLPLPRLLGPRLQPYSGTALILRRSTERRRLIETAENMKKTTSSNWHSLIQMNHLKYTLLIKPVSFSHPTLNLHCEINSTLFHPPISATRKGGCKQSFLSSHSSSSFPINTCENTRTQKHTHSFSPSVQIWSAPARPLVTGSKGTDNTGL